MSGWGLYRAGVRNARLGPLQSGTKDSLIGPSFAGFSAVGLAGRWESGRLVGMNRVGAMSVACIVVMAMCLVGISRLPYGYYTLLRIAVCVLCFASVLVLAERGVRVWQLVPIGVALLYNPLVPISLPREAWEVINACTAGVAVVGAVVMRRPRSKVVVIDTGAMS